MTWLQTGKSPNLRNAPLEFVVVGHIVWDGNVATGRPTVQPALSSIINGADTMLAKIAIFGGHHGSRIEQIDIAIPSDHR